MRKNWLFKIIAIVFITFSLHSPGISQTFTYPIVGTGQTNSYNNSGTIAIPSSGQSFFGQNSNYQGNQPSYTINGDGTIKDNVTGLIWQKTPDRNADGAINYYDKLTYSEALSAASCCNTAGFNDWRLPTIKELYSLIMYYGAEPNPTATSQGTAVPYINTNYFSFGFGDLNASSHGANANERLIDAQYATSSIYVSTTMGGQSTMFGVNFADGRIKGYPAGNQKKYYVLYCRGNPEYGKNEFTNNGNGTITDHATGLMWMKNDNGSVLSWENALNYAENFLYAGYSDWRLPDAKELQSIIDYTRSPEKTHSAAIDTLFNCTQIMNEANAADYPYYMSSTSFCSLNPTNGRAACYLSFGRALGYMSVHGGWIDVHGAGAQRSDPKTGDPKDYPFGFGPQGDAIRILNYVRLVRNASITLGSNEIKPKEQLTIYPNPVSTVCKVLLSQKYKEIKTDIYTITGEKIQVNTQFDSDAFQINLADLPKGIFFMTITCDGNRTIRKFIKV
jgi:hypothetical protein